MKHRIAFLKVLTLSAAIGAVIAHLGSGCMNTTGTIRQVTVADFKKFVDATGYKTDIEREGVTVVAEANNSLSLYQKVSWRNPDGQYFAKAENPVTQVTFFDASLYCEYMGGRLPTVAEFWAYAAKDLRPKNINQPELLPNCNIVGGAWDWTSDAVLVGGSWLCSESTCRGYDPKNERSHPLDEGANNIGFSIISN